jgi:hypothetical protein
MMSGPALYLRISHFYDFLRTTNVYGSVLSLSAILIIHPLGITLHLSPTRFTMCQAPLFRYGARSYAQFGEHLRVLRILQ